MNYNKLLKSTISPTPQPPMNPSDNFHGGGGGGGGLADHFFQTEASALAANSPNGDKRKMLRPGKSS